jgi:hypothetical protein
MPDGKSKCSDGIFPNSYVSLSRALMKSLPQAGPACGSDYQTCALLETGKAGVDVAEYVADDGSEDHQSRNNNNGYQNKNQRIFNEALAFFFGGEKHGLYLLSFKFPGKTFPGCFLLLHSL